jgi:predicted heme/steroid binding protein
MSNSGSIIPLVTFLAVTIIFASLFPALATEDYSVETGQECSVCHISASGGGGLTSDGESYSADPDNWLPPKIPRKRIPVVFRFVHMVILYTHIFFGIIWIGTILYVHLVLKPKYALGGLPRSELRLAWISMPLIALTGVLLTIWRMRLASGLFSTMFGKLLLFKIGVFVLMLSSATFVTLYVGPRLKSMIARSGSPGDPGERGRLTLDDLDGQDGTGGSRTLIAAMGQVYDVSSSPLWKGGLHANRHKAGQDLTDYLKNAPHEKDVLDRFENVGELVTGPVIVPPVVRIFTVNAYFNLISCFLIILVLVLWRW